MAWKVPLFDLDITDQDIDAVTRALKSGWISMGEATLKFEQVFAKAHDATYGVAVSSCTAALHLSLDALDIGPGDEVICPSLTFVATANSILYVGATPVFADISSSEDLTISPDDVRKKISDKTRAIMVMHYAGFPCDMDAINEIARTHGCSVIEDAAHAPLAEYKGKKVGSLGDVACFSFFSNKNLTTAEGGMLLTDDSEIAEQARVLRSHGMTALSYDRFKGHASSYDVIDLGYNYRLDDIRASLGLAQFGRLCDINARRRQLWEQYSCRLLEIEEVILPFSPSCDMAPEWTAQPYILPIILAHDHNRDTIRNRLADEGIQTSVHYPPVHLFKIYQERFGYGVGDLPVTEQVSDRVISLPFYPSMDEEIVEFVVDGLKRALRT